MTFKSSPYHHAGNAAPPPRVTPVMYQIMREQWDASKNGERSKVVVEIRYEWKV